ncbi:hypothetical protein [Paenibacillus koleovorans]|uniref:hypothetical protein n=1 Tax=Paenibacillus koleovorans TaxID=121608 RepID=UPI000FD7186A|nr:hypothetical protein [Paenibacillus koleovorans]
MSRYTMTLLGLLFMAAFGIFFGVEIASRGMERIQGPFPAHGYTQPPVPTTVPTQTSVRTPPPSTAPGAGIGKGQGGGAPTVTPLPPIGAGGPAVGAGDSGINKLGNGIGDLLSGMAQGTIRTVVGIFDGIVN